MATRLPTAMIDGKEYFIDKRLQQARAVDNPHDCLDLCEECKGDEFGPMCPHFCDPRCVYGHCLVEEVEEDEEGVLLWEAI